MAEGYKLLSVSNPYQNSFQNEFLDREEMSEWSFRNRFLRGYQEDDATENKEDDGEGNKAVVIPQDKLPPASIMLPKENLKISGRVLNAFGGEEEEEEKEEEEEEEEASGRGCSRRIATWRDHRVR
ncbi:hypothetical protein K0M31_005222 [Melipona bicolor]|uniref:Uncharacterized protein n=1 Tax=Melipona bicolor TaxID=60889 RepID=A0AA40KM94_9HYME|nr:hypothetical protein K0M31_005222 [Melipona bicolor]